MRMGIIGAMESEIEALKSQMTIVHEEHAAGMSFFEGTLENVQIVLARAGIGKVSAAMCAQYMLVKFPVDGVLNIGVAGALAENLKIGDIVVASCAVQHDVDTTALGDPPGMVSGVNVVEFPCDAALKDALIKAVDSVGVRGKVCAIATGDQFIADIEKKRAIAARFGAGACDMEGGAIAQACYAYQTPYAAYRAISDTMRGNGLEYQVNLSAAAAASAAVLKAFLNGVS